VLCPTIASALCPVRDYGDDSWKMKLEGKS
jgi:hypothetical protein